MKDNLTFSLDKWGRQNFKVGGIYNYQANPVFLCNRCMGSFDMQGGPVPANIEQLFPVWNDISTWNLNALAPITRSYTLGVGKMDANAVTQLGVDVVSGRLADRIEADAEPRRALRPDEPERMQRRSRSSRSCRRAGATTPTTSALAWAPRTR